MCYIHNFIFRGLVPRVIGEAITIALINLLSDLINQYLVEEKVCSECLLCVWFCPAEAFQLSIFSPCHLVIAVHSLPFLNSHSGFTHSLQSSYIYHFFSFLILFQFFEAFISFVLILKFHVILLSGFIFIIFFKQFYTQLLCIRIIVNHASTVHSLFKNKYAINVQWVYFYITSACLGG